MQKGEGYGPGRPLKLSEEKHRVHSASEVAKESIISYKQRYTNALKSYHDQGKPSAKDSYIKLWIFPWLRKMENTPIQGKLP